MMRGDCHAHEPSHPGRRGTGTCGGCVGRSWSGESEWGIWGVSPWALKSSNIIMHAWAIKSCSPPLPLLAF
jgi:hypothetical protein